MAKIYQGESLTMVFRCRTKCNRPVSLNGVGVSVLFRDVNGDEVFRFSNMESGGTESKDGNESVVVKELLVRENCVICCLSNEDMANICGCYVVEVKVRVKDTVMIAISKKIKVYSSVIGENVNL